MSKNWSELEVGDTIYMMTPIEEGKESELLECEVTYFSQNEHCKQYIIDIRNTNGHNYRVFIKMGDNNKICMFTYFHARSNSFRALISLNEKELVEYYINDVRELCDETCKIYDQAYISWQSMLNRLKYWEKVYESIKEE